jgi:hypothetical protein
MRVYLVSNPWDQVDWCLVPWVLLVFEEDRVNRNNL